MKKNDGFGLPEFVLLLVILTLALLIGSCCKNVAQVSEERRTYPERFDSCPCRCRFEGGLTRDMRSGDITNKFGDVVETSHGVFVKVLHQAKDKPVVTPIPATPETAVSDGIPISDDIVEMENIPQRIKYKGHSYIHDPDCELCNEDDVARILRAAESMSK